MEEGQLIRWGQNKGVISADRGRHVNITVSGRRKVIQKREERSFGEPCGGRDPIPGETLCFEIEKYATKWGFPPG